MQTNVIELKRNVMVPKVKKVDKTINKHKQRIIKLKKFTKSEINALTKLLMSYRFADDARKTELEHFQDETLNCEGSIEMLNGQTSVYANIMMFGNGPCKITKEQTTLGKNYLKNKYHKLDGRPRACGWRLSKQYGEDVLDITRNVHRFEFVGVLMTINPWDGGVGQVLPIYRTYNRKGEYFDYAPIHWGEPVILQGGVVR